MIKQLLMFIFMVLSCQIQAQRKQVLEKYIIDKLSYQHIKVKASNRKSQINILKIEFTNCTMSYVILKENKEKTEYFTVRILLSGISKIAMRKSKEGYYSIEFTTNGKSIVKEYPDGQLMHQKKQFIPLKSENLKALQSFEELRKNCLK